MNNRSSDTYYSYDRAGFQGLGLSPVRYGSSPMAIIQTLAIIAMLLDHTSLAFGIDPAIRSTVGRMALPLFCFMVAHNALHTPRPERYPWRILVIAFVAQFPFAMLTGNAYLANICFTLSGAAFFITGLRLRSSRYLVFAMSLLAFTLGIEYGLLGYLLVLSFAAALIAMPFWLFPLLVWPVMQYGFYYSALFAALATLVVVLSPISPIQWDRLPRWLTLTFYPAHLSALYVLSLVWS